MRSKAYWGYDEAFLDACREELRVEPDEVARRRTVVAESDDGRVLGFATLVGSPPVGELGMLFVEPDVIGQGIGRRLFEHVLGTARELGFSRITIDSDPYAEPVYLAMGAVRIGESPSGSIPGRWLPRLEVRVGADVT